MKGFYFLTGLGHEAVVVFFVISGFLVGGLSLQRAVLKRFDMASFFINRFARIYTVLFPALIFGALLDYMGYTFLNNSQIYTDSAQYKTDSLNFVIANSLSFATFVGNLFMLQGSTVPSFGSNSPLWSLAYEWWYYCVFAFAATLYFSDSRWVRIFCISAILMLFALLSHPILLWAAVWALGVLAWLYWKSSLPKPHPLVSLAIFLGALVLSRRSHSSENVDTDGNHANIGRDLMLGFGYCLLLASMLTAKMEPRFASLNRTLANFSYSLYLSHFPALIFIVACLYPVFGRAILQQPSFQTFGYAAAISTALILCAFGFYSLTEAHTDRLRRWLENLGRNRARVSVRPQPSSADRLSSSRETPQGQL